MNKIGKFFVGVLLAMSLVTCAFAADTAVKASTNAPVAVTTTPAPASDWVFTLGGSGVTTTTGDSQSALGVNFSVAKELNLFKLTEELGVRQSIGYSSGDGGNTLLSTKPYLDVNVFKFNLTKDIPVTLFVGANAGLTYGNTTPRWSLAPEAGADVWLAKNVAVEARAEYAFNIDNSGFNSQDALGWFLGVKFKF